ncbi:MAG: 3-oxoacyl-ACP reductase FabG [Pseudomonadota bacterium]
MTMAAPEKRIAMVTGAARGIGRALSVGMAEAGFDLIVCDIPSQKEPLQETVDLVKKTGVKVVSVVGDVSNKDDVQRMASDAESKAGRIDILVNNAGILAPSTLQELSEDVWDAHMAVNAKGTLLMMQAVLPGMQERKWGRIINIASLAGRQGIPTQGHYAASKSAVITLTRVLAQEVGDHGITVNAICPGIILTEMGRKNLGTEDDVRYWEKATSLKRLGRPEDVVGPAVFFASDQSAFVTGQSLNVCGGLYFH